jgi:hypothetical protein
MATEQDIASQEPQPAFQEDVGATFAPTTLPNPVTEEVDDPEVAMFDVQIDLDESQEKAIVDYLENNLLKMEPPDTEIERIRSYLGMYEMAVAQRSFPYEGAPSLASSDAHDALNEWLDTAEVAFLQNRVTFTIDREEVDFSEDKISRMEKTMQRKFFLKTFSPELRLMLFEASFLGGSITCTRENFDIRPVKEKIVIKTAQDLDKYRSSLTKSQENSAKTKIANGDYYITERESIKIINIGPIINRIDQTKFWYPRNTKSSKEWQIVAEQEFYTKSAMEEMVERGEFNRPAVEEALLNRQSLKDNLSLEDSADKNRLPEHVNICEPLDTAWQSAKELKELGDTYEDEFAVYRVTMLYKLPTKLDPSGRLRSWIQVMYCPSGRRILSANCCQDGFPYHLVQYRPVPYRAIGAGIAQERYHHNILDTDLKSLFLCCIEQEVGAPLLIRKTSSLFASGFRAFPGAVSYTEDINQDVKFVPFPEKSRLAANGMSTVLGSSPSANKGAGYASGKREELMQSQHMSQMKARIHSLAVDIDKPFNAAWKIFCRMSKFNKPDKKIIDWVYDTVPSDVKLYILEDEMDPDISWSSVLSAVSLTPDARLQEYLMQYNFFYKEQPSMQGNPKKTIAWLNRGADFFGIDEKMRPALLPSEEDFQQYQSQLGQMGGERQQAPTTPAAAQSSSTPFSRPAASPAASPKPAGAAPTAPQAPK